MSSTETRMPLQEAQALAERVVDILTDSCQTITIAGSIRRRRPDVGDIEIVCVPRIDRIPVGLFGDIDREVDCLDERCETLILNDHFSPRLNKNGVKALGSRYRRLYYHPDEQTAVPLDLFSPSAENFGAILAIRTGPSEYSRRFVTPRSQGGLMTDHLRMQEGSLRYRVSGEAIPTPTEESFFAAIGVGMLAPEDRS